MTQLQHAVERRSARFFDVKLRASGEPGNDSLTLTGYAAVFDEQSLPLYDWWYGEFVERIAPGAFTAALARGRNVHLVYSHDMSSAMASRDSNTLELYQDDRGLKVVAQLDPNDVDVQRLAPKMSRGIVNEMSFAFTVARDQWIVEELADGTERVERVILEVDELFEASVVPQGAYPQTEAGMREMRSRIVDAADRGLIPARREKREGKVLSTASREVIQAAVDSLQGLLDTATGERGRTARARFKELRADVESLEALVAMYEWGIWFIDLENAADDAVDRESMQKVLDELDRLIQVEAVEPYEPDPADQGDDPEESERSRRAGDQPAGGANEEIAAAQARAGSLPSRAEDQPAGEAARDREAEAMRMHVVLAEHLAISSPKGES